MSFVRRSARMRDNQRAGVGRAPRPLRAGRAARRDLRPRCRRRRRRAGPDRGFRRVARWSSRSAPARRLAGPMAAARPESEPAGVRGLPAGDRRPWSPRLTAAGVDNVRLVRGRRGGGAAAGSSRSGPSASCGRSSPTRGTRSGTTSAAAGPRSSSTWSPSGSSPAGLWRLATDWADYADQMRGVLDAHPAPRRRNAGGRAGRTGRSPGSRRAASRGARPVSDLRHRRAG